jgi:hypothetical protein
MSILFYNQIKHFDISPLPGRLFWLCLFTFRQKNTEPKWIDLGYFLKYIKKLKKKKHFRAMQKKKNE